MRTIVKLIILGVLGLCGYQMQAQVIQQPFVNLGYSPAACSFDVTCTQNTALHPNDDIVVGGDRFSWGYGLTQNPIQGLQPLCGPFQESEFDCKGDIEISGDTGSVVLSSMQFPSHTCNVGSPLTDIPHSYHASYDQPGIYDVTFTLFACQRVSANDPNDPTATVDVVTGVQLAQQTLEIVVVPVDGDHDSVNLGPCTHTTIYPKSREHYRLDQLLRLTHMTRWATD